MAIAALVRSISVSGYGAAAASGSVYFYKPGTTTYVPVYQDAEAAAVYAQPVILDGEGRSTSPVYALDAVRMQVYSSTGALVEDFEIENTVTALQVGLNSTSFGSTYETLDDALTSLALSNGAQGGMVKADGIGTVSRTVHARLTEAFWTLTDFGAVGDGITDCTGAWFAAINALLSAGGGELFIPSGTFVVTASLSPPSGTVPIKLRGVGRKSIISFQPAAASATMLTVTFGGSSAFSATSLTLTCTQATPTFFSISGGGGDCSIQLSDVHASSSAVGLVTLLSDAATSTQAALLSCRCIRSDGTTVGQIAAFPATAAFGNVTAIGCHGEINVAAGAAGSNVTVIGGAVNVVDNAASSRVNILGGTGSLTTTGKTPMFLNSDGGGYTYSGDAATDSLFTVNATSTVSIGWVQSLVTIKASTAAITVTVAAGGTIRNTSPMTVRFWNNTAGAVTWAAGSGLTFRGGVPAPGAGNSVYVTFVYDSNSSSWTETARS